MQLTSRRSPQIELQELRMHLVVLLVAPSRNYLEVWKDDVFSSFNNPRNETRCKLTRCSMHFTLTRCH